jgi:hypothetical protein
MTLKELHEQIEDWYYSVSEDERNQQVYTHKGYFIDGIELEEDPMWGDSCFIVMSEEDERDDPDGYDY